jgi:hypothetical protein
MGRSESAAGLIRLIALGSGITGGRETEIPQLSNPAARLTSSRLQASTVRVTALYLQRAVWDEKATEAASAAASGEAERQSRSDWAQRRRSFHERVRGRATVIIARGCRTTRFQRPVLSG